MALGYANPKNAVPSHVDDEDKLSTQIKYSGQMRSVTLINESGLYSLIFGSKLEKAKRFKHWVTSEVLPCIRKTFLSCSPSSFAVFLWYQESLKEETSMKKKLKKSLIILLSVIMIFSLPISASAATRKDVTKTYRKSVTKMLEGFDSYFAYCCGRRQYFKFDNYARTTMVTMKNYNLWEKNISYVKKKIQPQLKLYFNTSTVKFTKFTKYGIPRNPSYLLCNKNGKIVYTGGNWGEDSPNGVVKKIIKTGSNTYEVTYNLYFYSWMTKKNYGYMGTYKVYLKKTNNKNGFIITNIKQTVNKKNSL